MREWAYLELRKNRHVTRLALLAVLLLAACGRQRPGDLSPAEAELCVANETVGYGNVIARAQTTRFDVQSGHTECKRINLLAGTVIQAATTAGGASGRLSFRTRLPGTPGCWLWRLENSGLSSLFPCE